MPCGGPQRFAPIASTHYCTLETWSVNLGAADKILSGWGTRGLQEAYMLGRKQQELWNEVLSGWDASSRSTCGLLSPGCYDGRVFDDSTSVLILMPTSPTGKKIGLMLDLQQQP
eukprot:1161387-Pelagomonas_calceolata.AAC.6